MSDASTRETATHARARAGVYDLLAGVFRAPMHTSSLRTLRSPPFLEAMACAGVELDEVFRESDESELVEVLAVDFTDLFHMPRHHVAAYESVRGGQRWSDGALCGDATAAVGRFLESVGLLYDPDQSELPDHISVELEGMAELARAEAVAWEADDGIEAGRRCRHQTRFLTEHLGRWGSEFGQTVARKADTRFYREMGRLLAEFLESDARELARRLESCLPTDESPVANPTGEDDHAATRVN